MSECCYSSKGLSRRIRTSASGYLSGPIVAVPVPLAVYRIHGENLFHSPGSEIRVERIERRIKTFGILVEGMKNWLTTHGHNLNEPGVTEFFVQWSLSQEADEFAIRPPGRFRFFWHLFRYNYYFAPRLTWRLMLVNYVTAFGALALGYKHVYLIEIGCSASDAFWETVYNNSYAHRLIEASHTIAFLSQFVYIPCSAIKLNECFARRYMDWQEG